MNITLNPTNHQFSSLRTVHFATAEEKAAAAPNSNNDQITISQEGRNSLETLADKVESQLGTITKEDFMGMVKQLQSTNQKELPVNPYSNIDVDPDGSIARKTYFESYLGQLQAQEDTIKSYYADAYEEAVSSSIPSLSFISGKYLCSWSDCYDPSIPAKERPWTHFQLKAMLTGTNVALNDPYALASSGGPKTVDQMDKIARQAVIDKLAELSKQRENL